MGILEIVLLKERHYGVIKRLVGWTLGDVSSAACWSCDWSKLTSLSLCCLICDTRET